MPDFRIGLSRKPGILKGENPASKSASLALEVEPDFPS